jgi:predicted transcriptional regulator
MSTIVLSGEVADTIESQAKTQGYTSSEAFIQEAVSLLVKRNIDLHIDRGIEDIEAGRYRSITRESGEQLIDSLFDKHIQTQ